MRIALHGPMYSGKTTLLQELVNVHGYSPVVYNDHLKLLAAQALSSIGVSTSIEEVKTNKGKYRGFLQHLGTLVGFDEGAYVEQCLIDQASIVRPWFGELKYELADDIVFDNVRTQAQFDILKSYGFILVRLQIDSWVQIERATKLDVPISELANVSNHFIENPMPQQEGEILLNGAVAAKANADLLVNDILPEHELLFGRIA